jgi:hypothetical protein
MDDIKEMLSKMKRRRVAKQDEHQHDHDKLGSALVPLMTSLDRMNQRLERMEAALGSLHTMLASNQHSASPMAVQVAGILQQFSTKVTAQGVENNTS